MAGRMIEYFYPEEVDRETRKLRRVIALGPHTVCLTSELPMEVTPEEIEQVAEHLHRLWRRAWLRHRDRVSAEFAGRNPLVKKDRASWAAWKAHREAAGLDPQNISA